jgi:hypothetical protein
MCIEEKIQMDGQKKFATHVNTKWMIAMSTHSYDFNMSMFLPSGVTCQ